LSIVGDPPAARIVEEVSMKKLIQPTPTRLGVLLLLVVVAVFGSLMGTTFAAAGSHAATSTPLPCQLGGDNCINIGFTEAWLNGKTVDLEYSHDFFCQQPPSSAAQSQCEAGAGAQTNPPSGDVVSPLRTVTPMGFTPPTKTLQCPVAGQCIDHPHDIDLSRLFGSSDATLPPHSHILVDDESFQSTWWPIVVVGVKNIQAWNQIVQAKSETAVQACQAAGNCTPDIPTNGFLFFQVLGPGGSTTGPS
jgi:hypothetical protein